MTKAEQEYGISAAKLIGFLVLRSAPRPWSRQLHPRLDPSVTASHQHVINKHKRRSPVTELEQRACFGSNGERPGSRERGAASPRWSTTRHDRVGSVSARAGTEGHIEGTCFVFDDVWSRRAPLFAAVRTRVTGDIAPCTRVTLGDLDATTALLSARVHEEIHLLQVEPPTKRSSRTGRATSARARLGGAVDDRGRARHQPMLRTTRAASRPAHAGNGVDLATSLAVSRKRKRGPGAYKRS